MADEIKETSAAEATPETPKKKRDWKGKRLPIVIAVVVAATVLALPAGPGVLPPVTATLCATAPWASITTRSRIRPILWRMPQGRCEWKVP